MKVQTRQLYGGAYKSSKSLENHLTHLVEMTDDEGECLRVLCGKAKPEHVVEDPYAYDDLETELAAEPTCKSCAAKWRKLHSAPKAISST